MKQPSRADAEKILVSILENTLVNKEDIIYIKSMIRECTGPLPMKGIAYCYGKMEKREMSKDDCDDFATLMHFWGP